MRIIREESPLAYWSQLKTKWSMRGYLTFYATGELVSLCRGLNYTSYLTNVISIPKLDYLVDKLKFLATKWPSNAFMFIMILKCNQNIQLKQAKSLLKIGNIK